MIRLKAGRLAWYPPDAGGTLCFLDDELAREQLQLAANQPGARVCFAAPGADVTLFQMEIGPQEKKHIGKSLPFMLEESVAADIDDLHFSCEIKGKMALTAAVCTHAKMQQWQGLLADIAAVDHWVPEPLLLPWQHGEWSLLIEPDVAIVRTGAFAGFSTEPELLPAMLQSMLGDSAAGPQTVVIYGQDQQQDSSRVPDTLRDRIQWRRGDLCAALLLHPSPPAGINLRQGDYAVRLPLARWAKQWRAAAAVVAVAFCVQLVATYAQLTGLERENEALRAGIEHSYRRAYPKGALVDAQKQLSRQLGALRGASQTSGFVSLVSRVGEVISAHPGTRIASINYNDRGDEIRMNITARNFEAVDDIHTALNRAGLSATMESSNAQGDQVRARMRIGAGS